MPTGGNFSALAPKRLGPDLRTTSRQPEGAGGAGSPVSPVLARREHARPHRAGEAGLTPGLWGGRSDHSAQFMVTFGGRAGSPPLSAVPGTHVRRSPPLLFLAPESQDAGAGGPPLSRRQYVPTAQVDAGHRGENQGLVTRGRCTPTPTTKCNARVRHRTWPTIVTSNQRAAATTPSHTGTCMALGHCPLHTVSPEPRGTGLSHRVIEEPLGPEGQPTRVPRTHPHGPPGPTSRLARPGPLLSAVGPGPGTRTCCLPPPRTAGSSPQLSGNLRETVSGKDTRSTLSGPGAIGGGRGTQQRTGPGPGALQTSLSGPHCWCFAE